MTTPEPTAEATWFCNKCGFVGVPINEDGYHRRPKDDVFCNYTATFRKPDAKDIRIAVLEAQLAGATSILQAERDKERDAVVALVNAFADMNDGSGDPTLAAICRTAANIADAIAANQHRSAEHV